MTDIENYHNWLRDAHAMEKQAESLLVATIRRLDNEPQLRTRLEQHLYE
ncbi:ferritin-like domain-containing protein, partial [Mycobacterium tuberculosis]